MRRPIATFLLLLLVTGPASAHEGLIHTGCDPTASFTQGPITVSAAFARAMPPRAPTAAGYLTISNNGEASDTLLGASSEAAQAVLLHAMSVKNDMMTMAPVEGGLEVPAKGSVSLSPDGYHLMFTGIPTPFKQGECVEVVLHFAKAGDLPVVLSIAGVAADAPPEHQMEMGGMDMGGMEMGGAK
jgi:copper(I)-binding protein